MLHKSTLSLDKKQVVKSFSRYFIRNVKNMRKKNHEDYETYETRY